MFQQNQRQYCLVETGWRNLLILNIYKRQNNDETTKTISKICDSQFFCFSSKKGSILKIHFTFGGTWCLVEKWFHNFFFFFNQTFTLIIIFFGVVNLVFYFFLRCIWRQKRKRWWQWWCSTVLFYSCSFTVNFTHTHITENLINMSMACNCIVLKLISLKFWKLDSQWLNELNVVKIVEIFVLELL